MGSREKRLKAELEAQERIRAEASQLEALEADATCGEHAKTPCRALFGVLCVARC